jgi:hypothetical protein
MYPAPIALAPPIGQQWCVPPASAVAHHTHHPRWPHMGRTHHHSAGPRRRRTAGWWMMAAPPACCGAPPLPAAAAAVRY